MNKWQRLVVGLGTVGFLLYLTFFVAAAIAFLVLVVLAVKWQDEPPDDDIEEPVDEPGACGSK